MMPIILALFSFLVICNCYAAQVFLGFYKPLTSVQDKKGKEVSNPYSPILGMGYNFRLSNDWGFSPQIGYIYQLKKSDDGYNKYQVHTFPLLYDFVWLPFDSLKGDTTLALRMGIGNFIKRVRGKGGTVTVPNGLNSSSTASRSSTVSTSYSGTFNLGADFTFNALRDYFDNFGVRFETFIFRPLSQDYRNYAFKLCSVGYF